MPFFVPPVVGSHDRNPLGCNADVAQHQRQHALADAAETDEQDARGKLDVDLVLFTHDGC